MIFPGIVRVPDSPPVDTSERSQDLENLVGNLMITEHQASRLRERVADHCMSLYTKEKNKSRFMFRTLKGEWFEVRLEVNKMNEDKEESEPAKHEPVEFAVLDTDDMPTA